VAAVALLVTARDPAPRGPAVARVERVLGSVDFDGDGRRRALRVGDELAAGATLATGSGQVSLRLASGGSLRIAPETHMTLASANAAELDAGALYFDSEHAAARGEPFAIETQQGTGRDVGPQFVARIDTAALEVGVRDGRVSLTRGTSTTAAAAGEKLTVGRGTEVLREPLSTFGSDWAWTERLAPPFDIDGRRLIEVLEWVAAQTGRKLEFASPALERLARDTVLSGSIDLEPMQKLVAVLATTGDLDYAIEGGRLLILLR
jgi:ferric-dicitrate binding protein FerR (iron transport regulator)